MKRLPFIAAALLLASCASPLPQTPPAGMAGEVAAQQPTIGVYWRYAVSDGFTKIPQGTVEYRVSGIRADTVTMTVRTEGQESTEIYTRDGNWLRRPATNLQVFDYKPAYRAFDFPLAAGKAWRAKAMATDPTDGRSFPVLVEGKVLGWERVKVPAGEFDTLKVRRNVFLDYYEQGVRGQSVILETDWYAPSVGQVVRRETTSQYLRLARLERPYGFVRVNDDPSDSDGEPLPRYEQDDWRVYELVAYGRSPS